MFVLGENKNLLFWEKLNEFYERLKIDIFLNFIISNYKKIKDLFILDVKNGVMCSGEYESIKIKKKE